MVRGGKLPEPFADDLAGELAFDLAKGFAEDFATVSAGDLSVGAAELFADGFTGAGAATLASVPAS